MIKIKSLLLLACLTVCLAACKKNEVEEFDQLAQFSKDTAAISAFVKANNITGGTMDPEYGIYYKVIEPGVGNVKFNGLTSIKFDYVGRFLNGNVFDESKGTVGPYLLGDMIAGWYYGIPKIQKGGKVRLIIPSYYGYGNRVNPRVPVNSILDFDVTLVDVVE
ncbi:MAG: peptidylprolyl isomerase [Pedobacter sp.]|nr:MAG: peptidylprolyl isomerase [Pedobacter sp.]